jgi:hypothetical protein
LVDIILVGPIYARKNNASCRATGAATERATLDATHRLVHNNKHIKTMACADANNIPDDLMDQKGHGHRDDDDDTQAPPSSLWDLLPDELVIWVLATAEAEAVAAWSLTSRRHRLLGGDIALWRHLYESRFGSPLHVDFVENAKDWRWLYRARACDGHVAGATAGEIVFAIDGVPALYWGDLVDGLPHGYGLLSAYTVPTGIDDTAIDQYEGDFHEGKYHGRGVCVWPAGHRYRGDYANGKKHGHGICTWPDGSRYEGAYVDDKRHGRGVHTWSSGAQYEGDYVQHEMHGYGHYRWPDGARYQGAYMNGKRHAHGMHTWPSGARYEGDYTCDKMHGRGVYT